MPAVSKKQQRFMGMVHAAQKGEKPASKAVANVAKSISKKAAKDFAETPQKGLPDKKEAAIKKLREYLRKRIMKEMNITGNVQGYNTPNAFTPKGDEQKKAKKQADLTGYSAVNEIRDIVNKIKSQINEATYTGSKYGHKPTVTIKDTINENRWLELKREDTPATAKIGKGISHINKQLAEVEKFLNWYGRIKQESGTTNEDFWKRTNSNIYRIKERLIKLEQQIRKFT